MHILFNVTWLLFVMNNGVLLYDEFGSVIAEFVAVIVHVMLVRRGKRVAQHIN